MYATRQPLAPFRLNLAAPLAKGLVFWLPLIDHSLRDVVHGLTVGASSTVPLVSANGPGRAFLNSSTSYLLGTSVPVTAPPFTMACWFNPTSTTSTRDLVSLANGGNTSDYFELATVSTGVIRARSADSTTTSTASTTATITANKWQLAVGVFAATNSRSVYLDGGNKVTQTSTRSTTGITQLGIAMLASSTLANFFGGNISNVCIWNRALSDAEVWQLYDPLTRWQLYDTRRVFVGLLSATLLSISDSGAGSEALGIGASFATSDSGHGADVPGGAAALALPDTAHSLDALGQLRATIARTDSGAGSDSVGNATVTLVRSDSGAGTDALTQLVVTLARSDNGIGTDALTQLLATIARTDSGVGNDSVGNASVTLARADSGTGADVLAQLRAALAQNDSGAGSDSVGNASVSLSRSDTGTGADALANLSNALAVADTGIGADGKTITVTFALTDSGAGVESIIKALLFAITDSGLGVDGVSNAVVALALADTGAASDNKTITATIGLSDSGHGVDVASITGVLLAIIEAGLATDAIGGATVSVPVADMGAMNDVISQITNTLSLLDNGQGVEVSVVYSTLVKLVKITFAFLRRTVQYSWRVRSIGFAFKQRSMAFEFLGNELG